MPETSQHNFQIGDRVLIIASETRPDLVGEETMVISNLIFFEGNRDMPGHRLDLPSSCGRGNYVSHPADIVLIYDGNETASWENCAWKPAEVVK